MRSIFQIANCPFQLQERGVLWNANIEIQKDKYYITFHSAHSHRPLEIYGNVIESKGETMEQAVENIKSILKQKGLIK